MKVDASGETNEIGKIEIAEQHFHTSIKMLAMELGAFSTHTVVMACRDLIVGRAASLSLPLSWDHTIYIKDEFHKEYLRKIKSPYNYFKHADRDALEPYNGPCSLSIQNVNEIQTSLNIIGFEEIGGKSSLAMKTFLGVVYLLNPQFAKPKFWDAMAAAGAPRPQELSTSRDVIYAALRTQLYRSGLLAQVPAV